MFRSLHIAATGMAAQESQLDTISNNLANVNTVGFKRARADFQDLMYQTIRGPGTPTSATTNSPTGLQVGSGVKVVSTSRIETQGALAASSNPLDVALEGKGFFVVQQPDGAPAYTRTGTFKTDAQGRVVTADGMPLDPPITIPPDALSVNIGADGIVSVTTKSQSNPTQVGQIQVANFVNPAGLSAIGHNMYVASQSSGEAQVGNPGMDGRGTLMQGMTEKANVEVVEEMINLIGAQRGYELNTKIISAADEMMRGATQLAR